MAAAEPSESIGVILPSYNVAARLPALLAELKRRWPDFRLLAVDDGSRDDTAAAARAGGAELIVHPCNRGKGAALATGFHWALAEGLDWVYTMDADGQHLPAEMGSFLDEARRGAWDVVVGTRMADAKRMPWLRRTTNRVTSCVVSRLAGVPIPDSQSGFRLFRTACLQGLALATSHYDAESEILVRLARRGYRIGSVPISTVYGDESSSIRPMRDTWRFIRLIWRLRRKAL